MKLRIEPIFTFTLIWMLLFGAVAATSKKSDAAELKLPQYAQQMEKKYDLQPNLLVAICTKESGWKNVKGSSGEIGVCQINPASLRHAFGSPQIDHPTLRFGSSGPYVKLVQALVGVKADGVFGPITAKAVQEYQLYHNLASDGIVGPLTWGSLIGPASYTKLLWNPYKNIEYAAKYLAWLRDTLDINTPTILMAAYNGGPGNPVVKYMVNVEQYRESLQPVTEVYF